MASFLLMWPLLTRWQEVIYVSIYHWAPRSSKVDWEPVFLAGSLLVLERGRSAYRSHWPHNHASSDSLTQHVDGSGHGLVLEISRGYYPDHDQNTDFVMQICSVRDLTPWSSPSWGAKSRSASKMSLLLKPRRSSWFLQGRATGFFIIPLTHTSIRLALLSLETSHTKFCTHFSSSPCPLHVPPVSLFSLWSFS